MLALLQISTSRKRRPKRRTVGNEILGRACGACVSSTAAMPEPVPSGVPFAADTDPVRIVSVSLSSTEFHPGDFVSGPRDHHEQCRRRDRAGRTIRVGVPRVAIGKFRLSLQLPNIPLPTGPQKVDHHRGAPDGAHVTRSVVSEWIGRWRMRARFVLVIDSGVWARRPTSPRSVIRRTRTTIGNTAKAAGGLAAAHVRGARTRLHHKDSWVSAVARPKRDGRASARSERRKRLRSQVTGR